MPTPEETNAGKSPFTVINVTIGKTELRLACTECDKASIASLHDRLIQEGLEPGYAEMSRLVAEFSNDDRDQEDEQSLADKSGELWESMDERTAYDRSVHRILGLSKDGKTATEFGLYLKFSFSIGIVHRVGIPETADGKHVIAILLAPER